MREPRPFLRSIDRGFFSLLLALILYAVVPFAEIFLFVWLGYAISIWLVLVIAAVVGLPGVPIAVDQVRRTLPRLRERIRQGRPSGPEIADLAGVLAGSLFLITPGFITDVLGYLLLVPSIRQALTRALARAAKKRDRELHRYLELNGITEGPLRRWKARSTV